jgi:hypothetical protein
MTPYSNRKSQKSVRVVRRTSDRLRMLFAELVRDAFLDQLHYHDLEVTTYIADLLTDFTRAVQLYKIRDGRGRRLEDVREMLSESDPLLEADSFDREGPGPQTYRRLYAVLHRALPEYLKWPRRSLRLDYFVDYVKAGKESHSIVFKLDQFEHRRVAVMLRRVAHNFELCVYGLNRVREALRRMKTVTISASNAP